MLNLRDPGYQQQHPFDAGGSVSGSLSGMVHGCHLDPSAIDIHVYLFFVVPHSLH